MHVTGLSCVICDTTYALGEVEYTCPRCGLEGILDVQYDYDAVARELGPETLKSSPEQTLWRYAPLLPVPIDAARPRLAVGCTPIVESTELAQQLGLSRVWVKDDGRNPTGSFKDRASAVGVARAAALGRQQIACSSTGNAATALAGLSADMGLTARIFVPKDAPEAKVAQLLIYGATVFLVDGPYEAAFDLCQAAIEEFGWYNRNCAVNPFLVEGKKTAGLEIAEQLAESVPDVVAIAVGDGCCVSGVGKGLSEMHRLGIIDRVPRILGVQAEKAAPLYDAFERGDEILVPVEATTLADSINVGTPRNWRKALRTVRKSGGAYVTVSDEAILAAIPRLARATGVFAEPTAAATLAGVDEAVRQGLIKAGESVLMVITGNGLKDVRGAMRAVTVPEPISANLEEVRRVVEA